MYDHFFGTIYHIEGNRIVFRCSGVGYSLQVPFSSLEALLNAANAEIMLFVHQVITESSNAIYGFATYSERETFKMLISVSGVGPTTAITILSAMSGGEIIAAIGSEDIAAFKRIKGIGQKTAEQIILDLFKKVERHTPAPTSDMTTHPDFYDAVDALVSLGYTKTVASKAVKAACGEADGLGDIVKLAIRYAQ